ncbi:hypothetical protein BSKO_04972 [Bryopsis sp. KO-2023]|nr:hypothetical protein BSKO_04972 [Bryopsis sp. KO-2023]
MAEDRPAVNVRELPVSSTEDSKASWRIEVDWKADEEEDDVPLLPRRQSGSLQFSEKPLGCIWNSGTGLLTLGAFTISVATLCVKLLHDRVPLFQLIAIRSLASCIILCFLCRSSGTNPMGPRELWPLLLTRGVSGAISMTMTFGSLFLIPLTDTTILFLTHPAWMTAICWLFRIEPIKWTMSVGVAICMAGVVLVTHPPIIFGGHQHWGLARIGGVALGLGGAIFATTSFLTVSKIGDRASPIVMTFWFQMVGFLSSVPVMFVGFPTPIKWGLSWLDIVLLAGVTLASSLSNTLVNRGLQISSATMGSVTLTSQILFATLWGIFLLNEPLSMVGLIGAVLIVLGVVMVSRERAAIKSSREAATEEMHRWSWDRLAAWRQTRVNEVELSAAERLARVFG